MIYTELDRDAVKRLLSLNDFQLKHIISKLASDYGLDLSSFNISESNIAGIRNALENASDEDIKKAAQQLEDFGKKGKGKR